MQEHFLPAFQQRIAPLLQLAHRPDVYTVPKQVLQQQQEVFGGRRWALFSDVNGTLEQKGRKPDATLATQLDHNSWLKVYTTGGSLAEVIKLVNEGKIPQPHIVVPEIAGPIHILRPEAAQKTPQELTPKDFVIDPTSQRRLRRHFHKDALMMDMDSVIGRLSREFADFHFGYRGSPQQPGLDSSNSRIRLEYSIPPGVSRRRLNAFRKQMQQLIDENFPNLSVITFQEGAKDRQDKHYRLLVVPWGKEDSIKRLSKKLHINGGIIAGDSNIDPLFDASLGPHLWRVPVSAELQHQTEKIEQAFRQQDLPAPTGRVHRVFLDWNRGQDPTTFVIDKTASNPSTRVARAVRMADAAWRFSRRYQRRISSAA